MDNEGPFAVEAQDEALLSGTESTDAYDLREPRTPTRARADDIDQPEDERAPLISPPRGRPTEQLSKGTESYERAINEPWRGPSGAAALPWYKKPSILWLLPPFFPFCIAFGGLLVPKTYLILDLICQDYLSQKSRHDPTFQFAPIIMGDENPQCRDPNVQARVARFNLYSGLISGVFSALISPHLGALSDRVGRKKIIALASAGVLAMEVTTIIVGTHPGEVSVYWILVGSLLDGLCGSFTTAMALAFAYAADCSPPERRNVSFGYFHANLFAGIALGPILAGYLINLTGTVMIVFYVALGCHVFFIFFVLFVVPESLSEERQALAREKYRAAKEAAVHKDWITMIKTYNLFEPLWVLCPRGPGTSFALRKNLILLAAIDTTMFGVAMGTIQIILIYAEFRFGFSAVDSSMFLSAVNVCRVAALVIVLPLLTRLVRGPAKTQTTSGHGGSDMLDIAVIRGAIVFDLLGYIGYAFTPNGAVMIISGMVAALGGIGSPTLQSSLTKHIPADRTGQVLGASGLLHALARVVAPTIFNLIYSVTVGKFAGTVFVCLASMFVLCFIMSWFLKPGVYFEDSAKSNQPADDTADAATGTGTGTDGGTEPASRA